MSQAASQAAAFFRDVAKGKMVWTIRDAAGFPATRTAAGGRAQPFWSSESRARRVIRNEPAYAFFEPVSVSLRKFRGTWLPRLEQDGLLVGVNWSGPRAIGYDYKPSQALERIDWEIQRLGSRS